MSIESTHVLVNGYKDTFGNQALARIDSVMSGCAHAIRLVNMGDQCGSYWLCSRKDDQRNDYILLLPSPRWEQDATDAGYTLVQKLNKRTTSA